MRFLSDLKKLAGTETCSLTVRENMTLREFLAIVDETHLKNKLLNKVGRKVYPTVILIDGHPGDFNQRLRDGSTITFAPVVSGG